LDYSLSARESQAFCGTNLETPLRLLYDMMKALYIPAGNPFLVNSVNKQ
jgi:hypothetical protein